MFSRYPVKNKKTIFAKDEIDRQSYQEHSFLVQTVQGKQAFRLTDRFNDESDIDLVVDFKKDEVEDYFDNYFDFKYSLQDLFGRKVDLVEEQSIKNPYFRKNVDSTKQLIYG